MSNNRFFIKVKHRPSALGYNQARRQTLQPHGQWPHFEDTSWINSSCSEFQYSATINVVSGEGAAPQWRQTEMFFWIVLNSLWSKLLESRLQLKRIDQTPWIPLAIEKNWSNSLNPACNWKELIKLLESHLQLKRIDQTPWIPLAIEKNWSNSLNPTCNWIRLCDMW
jgi:hypothetical protein